MAVDAVVYYRISNATVAVSNVEDYGRSTRLLAATTLRNVLGTKDLSQILSERESISHVMQSSLDEATDPWGVKVERVEMYAHNCYSFNANLNLIFVLIKWQKRRQTSGPTAEGYGRRGRGGARGQG